VQIPGLPPRYGETSASNVSRPASVDTAFAGSTQTWPRLAPPNLPIFRSSC